MQASFDRLVREGSACGMSALRQRLDDTRENADESRARAHGKSEHRETRKEKTPRGLIMVANVETEPTGATDDTEVEPSALKRLYLATLGGGVVIQEESGKLFEYLVERGTPLEEPVRQRVVNAREKIERDVARAGKAVNRAVGRVVSRHSDPKGEEVAELSEAADRLQERMDRL